MAGANRARNYSIFAIGYTVMIIVDCLHERLSDDFAPDLCMPARTHKKTGSLIMIMLTSSANGRRDECSLFLAPICGPALSLRLKFCVWICLDSERKCGMPKRGVINSGFRSVL